MLWDTLSKQVSALIVCPIMSRSGGFSGPYFPVFGVNTEIYRVTTRINSEYSKIRTRKTPKLDFFRLVINFSNLLFILRVLP